MKNATEYGKKVKGMLPSLKKRYAADGEPAAADPLSLFVLAVLRENAPADVAARNLDVLREEFVDFNELRVAPLKDIVELLEGDPADLRTKAARITDGLNRIFDQNNRLDFGHAADMGKRDLRTHLGETLGFSPYVEAFLLVRLFGHRAIPVDDALVQRLKDEDLAGPDAGVDDVRGLLERVVPAKQQAETAGILAAWAHDPAAARPAGKTAAKKTEKARKTKKASKTTKTRRKKTAKKKTKTAATKAAGRKKTARKTTKTKRK